MKSLFPIFLIFCSLQGNSQKLEKFVINFDFDKHDISATSKRALDSFVNSTSISSIKNMSLYGHCDVIGNHEYNDQLSIKRVNDTKEYLLRNNIPELVFDSLSGLGKRVPLNDNADANERFYNRRVEIIIERSEEAGETIPETQTEKPVQPERTLAETIKDTTTKTGTNIILKNMNFYGGRHILLPQSIPTLRELLSVLQENSTLEIEIQGHICCTFGPEDGLDIDTNTPYLSVNRARAIYEHLLSQGIARERLSYRGFGHRRPLVYPEDTEEKRTTNRRVEIKIIKK